MKTNLEIWLFNRFVFYRYLDYNVSMQKEDILKLADLAKLSINDEQANKLVSGMESILDYVKQISDVDVSDIENTFESTNITREDISTDVPEKYSDDIINEMPNHEGRYLKVKKILEGK